MSVFLVIITALAPGLFWMWWFYRQDIYNREPKRLLALLFILSMPLSFLIGLFQFSIDQAYRQGDRSLSNSDNIPAVILFYLLGVGLTEELGKFIVTYTLVYRHAAFDEEMDGIIYAAASGLGFATFENIFFVLDQGFYVILLRGPVSTLAHLVFAAMWGAPLGLAKFENDKRLARRRVINGLFWATVAHAVFDLLITLGLRIADWVSLLSIVFLVGLYFVVARQIRYALHISRFNPANAIRALRQRRGESRRSRPPRYVPNPYLQNRVIPDTNEDEEQAGNELSER